MGIQAHNELNIKDKVLNSLYTKVQGYTSQFLNTDVKEFGSYLKENFDSMDKNADNYLTKDEISASVKRDLRNKELQKLIDNNSLEKMLANIDTNDDGKISFSETNPNGNVEGLLKSAYKQINNNPQNLGAGAINFTQNLCKNYYASPMMSKLATSAVSALI